jgi:hypothetical protein
MRQERTLAWLRKLTARRGERQDPRTGVSGRASATVRDLELGVCLQPETRRRGRRVSSRRLPTEGDPLPMFAGNVSL